MYGYVYITTNTVNDKIYIGKKKSKKFINSYHGSGKNIKHDIEKFGKDKFTTIILETADSKNDLNNLEIKYINKYFNDGYNMYNIANGGDGGNTIKYMSDIDKANFIAKMTDINRTRCQSDEFKQKLRNSGIARFKNNPELRKKLSEKSKTIWSSESMRQAQSIRLKEYYTTHEFDNTSHYKSCAILFSNGNRKYFESVKDLKKYLNKVGYNPNNSKIKKLLDTNKPLKIFHKNKFKHLAFLEDAIFYRTNKPIKITRKCTD